MAHKKRKNNDSNPITNYFTKKIKIVSGTHMSNSGTRPIEIVDDETLQSSDHQSISEENGNHLSNSALTAITTVDRSNNNSKNFEVLETSKDNSVPFESSGHQSLCKESASHISNPSVTASESVDKANNNSVKSEEIENDHFERTKMEIQELVVDVDPNHVKLIQSKSSKSKEKKKSKKQVRIRKDTRKLNYSKKFILHTIDQYDKHLKTSEIFRGILTDESLVLLSTLTAESEDNKELVGYLFCVDQFKLAGTAEVDFPNEFTRMNYNCSSLFERDLITFSPFDADLFSFKDCLKSLTEQHIKETCSDIVHTRFLKPPEDIKSAITDIYNTRDIRDTKTSNDFTEKNRSEILNKLRNGLKKWKISDLARETINELIVLMHLDIIFEMGCSIDSTKMWYDRPGLKFTSVSPKKLYPVDKEMILDNASIIFQNREEFCGYLNARALNEEFKRKGKTEQDKCEMALKVCEMYKGVNDKNMSHYKSLPVWLRKFTPVYIYVEILNDGVKHLNNCKKYEEALEILNLLIEQSAFKQDLKAKWYHTKVSIQHKHLKSPESAAKTLYEAFTVGLSQESVTILREQTEKILRAITRSKIANHVRDFLIRNAEKKTSENSIQTAANYFDFLNERQTSKSKPRYMWNKELLPGESLCCNLYKANHGATLAEHWEGHVMNAIFFILFWDIIYTKPLGVNGIFLSHYQNFPLDMWCENFYINRKARIDERLTKIENNTVEDLIKNIRDRHSNFLQCKLRIIDPKKFTIENITTVVKCLDSQRLAAICRRLARNYKENRYGFPDLTICNTENYTIEFREVKTNDAVTPKQLQWLHYLNDHNIKAGFCFLNNNKEQGKTQDDSLNDSSSSTYTSMNEDLQSDSCNISASLNSTDIECAL